MNFRKYMRKKEAKQNQNQIPTLILIPSDYLKQTEAKNKKEENAKEPKNTTKSESEESENYFLSSED